MGIHDYVSYIRKNGQNLNNFKIEYSYLFYVDDTIDDDDSNNLDINYNLLSNVIKNFGESGEHYGKNTGMVITHAYPKGTPQQDIEKLFFRTDLLTPLELRIEEDIEYSWDKWRFDNGYGISPAINSTTGIWKLNFTNNTDNEIDFNKLKFIPNPLYDYYAVAIDPDSLKYILSNNELDVPFGLLDEIITNHNIVIDDNLTKRQVIDLVRTYFSDVTKYLNAYLTSNIIN